MAGRKQRTESIKVKPGVVRGVENSDYYAANHQEQHMTSSAIRRVRAHISHPEPPTEVIGEWQIVCPACSEPWLAGQLMVAVMASELAEIYHSGCAPNQTPPITGTTWYHLDGTVTPSTPGSATCIEYEYNEETGVTE